MPVAALQKRDVPSHEPETKNSPCGSNARLAMYWTCPVRGHASPVSVSQSRRSPFEYPAANQRPSGGHARRVTVAVCLRHCNFSSRLTCHTCTSLPPIDGTLSPVGSNSILKGTTPVSNC